MNEDEVIHSQLTSLNLCELGYDYNHTKHEGFVIVNLDKILLSALVSIILVTPVMPMEVMPEANPAQDPQMAQQPVIFQSNNGPINVVPMVTQLGEGYNILSLTKHSLQGNRLKGDFSREIGNLVTLKELAIGHNLLEGGIPEELGHLVELKSLGLFSNNLTGLIPPNIGRLIQLQYLDLHENNFTGGIPMEIKNLVHLRSINLENNLFTELDARALKTPETRVILRRNPLRTFMAPSNQQCRLDSNYENTHIHFDGSQIGHEEDLINLRGVLQTNVVSYGGEPLRIGFYNRKNDETQYNISDYLQRLGVNHDTAIVKNIDQSITVRGLAEGYDPQTFINLLEQVRDMPGRQFGGRTKAARN